MYCLHIQGNINVVASRGGSVVPVRTTQPLTADLGYHYHTHDSYEVTCWIDHTDPHIGTQPIILVCFLNFENQRKNNNKRLLF
jgi:hypothetical protein